MEAHKRRIAKAVDHMREQKHLWQHQSKANRHIKDIVTDRRIDDTKVGVVRCGVWSCFTGVMGSGVTVCDIWLSLCVAVNNIDNILKGYYRNLRFFFHNLLSIRNDLFY